MPEQDREVDLEQLVTFYEPLSHEDMLWWIRNRNFAEPNWIYMPVEQPDPWQGDVIPQAELHYTNKDGDSLRVEGPAMLLSHGCDTVPDQDPVAVMAPVFDVRDFEAEYPERVINLRKNQLSAIFFLPAVADLPERYVDFNFACSISTDRIQALFAEADPVERTRLTMRGWWLLTGKLAHHHARKESPTDYPRPFR